MSQPIAPCKDCKNRTIDCHLKCKLYHQYHKDLDKHNEQVKQQKTFNMATFRKRRKR